MVLAGHGSMN